MNGWGISSFKALLVRFCPDPISFCGALEPPFEDIAEANHHDHHDQLWWKQSWWTRPQETAARWLGAPAPSATSTSRPTSSPAGAFPETQQCGLRDAGSHLSDGCPWRCQTSAWDGAASAHGHPADASGHGAMWDAHPRTTGLRCSTSWMWWLHVALTWAPSHWEACVLGRGNSDLEAVGGAVPLRSGPHNHSWRVISCISVISQLMEVTIVIIPYTYQQRQLLSQAVGLVFLVCHPGMRLTSNRHPANRGKQLAMDFVQSSKDTVDHRLLHDGAPWKTTILTGNHTNRRSKWE